MNYPGCGGGVGGGLRANCYKTESNSEETGMDDKKEIKSTLPASQSSEATWVPGRKCFLWISR